MINSGAGPGIIPGVIQGSCNIGRMGDLKLERIGFIHDFRLERFNRIIIASGRDDRQQ